MHAAQVPWTAFQRFRHFSGYTCLLIHSLYCFFALSFFSLSFWFQSLFSPSFVRWLLHILTVLVVVVVRFAESCPQLQNVDLTENKRVSFYSVHSILEHCANLYSLSLCGCHQLNDESFRVFSENSSVAQQLQNINVSTVLLTDTGLSWIAGTCHKLSALDLTSNMAVTDAGVAHVVRACKNLKRLYLQSCKLV